MNELRAHPAAELFPPMEGEAFDGLVESIRKLGQLDPIITHAGEILDGLNRYRACMCLGITPMTKEWDGNGSAIDFVVAKNRDRRHLNESQKAMIASRLETLQRGRPNKDASLRVSRDEAAALMSVSPRSVNDAAVIRDHGTQEEAAAVDAGRAAVSTTAKKIRSRERQAKSLPDAPPAPTSGPKLRIPEGKTVEVLCREGLELEKAGLTAEVAAERLSLGTLSYRQGRDIVLIADRSDLSLRDAASASHALAEMNRTSRASTPYEIIRPIAKRLWGAHGTAGRAQTEASRIEQFERAVGVLLRACSSSADIDVPHLSSLRCTEINKELSAAENALRGLRGRIEEIHK